MIYEYIIIIVIFAILLLAVLKLNNKNTKFEINKLVIYLGGKENIIDAKLNLSRFVVTLRDTSKVDKDAITSLGAKGIVEVDNHLKIIISSGAKQLKKYIDEIIK